MDLPATPPKHTNRLAQETSPYLLQHAHNPVDWYAWGPEAFEAARSQDKPIFLSVGYSTCYWCHVMERQSFENEAIAAEMNKRFVNIKVDREERPDVDQLYMNAVQVLTRQGGWPMSVFLTPGLKPFYGGTYFPPADGHGRVGFPRLLAAIEDAYRNRPAEVAKSADQLVDALHRLAEPPPPEGDVTIDASFIEALVDRSASDYDPDDGGFGSAPKFPRQTMLELLLVHNRLSPNPTRLRRVLHTLDAMAAGGIHDQLGGAFHRYSTDARWLVPHFEIMLYDNAMLAWVYAEAFSQTQQARYAGVARGILEFVLREMTSPEGAFYTAFDAEVDAQEGLTYLWTPGEIAEVLGADAGLFNQVYGVDLGPNFADPHHGGGVAEKNILYLPKPLEVIAKRLNQAPTAMEEKLEPMRQALYAARRKRKQPLLDTKILTSWNGLMIRAFAHAGKVLRDERYLAAASKAADFLLQNHAMPGGGLYRASRDGRAKYSGFLDDYAFLAQGLLALADTGGDAKRREQAEAVAARMRERFEDGSRGGFYFSASDADDLLVRQKTAADSPLPSGNAVAAMTMLELHQPQAAAGAIAVFAGQMKNFGEGMSAMVQAALLYVHDQEPMIARAAAARAGEESPEGDWPLAPQQVAEGVVNLSAVWSQPDVLEVTAAILGDFHINAHEASEGLLATQLSVAGEAAESVAAIDYPPGEERTFAFSDKPVRVYSGAVKFAVRFRDLADGRRVTVSLYYQACTDEACLPPVTKTLEA